MPENLLFLEKFTSLAKGKNFTLPSAMLAVTNLTSALNNTVSKHLGVFPSIRRITC